jgi:hypothetical protein
MRTIVGLWLLVIVAPLPSANSAFDSFSLVKELEGTVKDQAAKLAAEKLAAKLQVSAQDPKAERAMDAAAHRDADTARQLFQGPMTVPSASLAARAYIYNPGDADQAHALLSRWKGPGTH